MAISLSGDLFAKMLAGGASELWRNRKTVNDLNVFPVPDGDTGDNMYMTVRAGSTGLCSGKLCDVADDVSGKMYSNAHGNSGAILYAIFAGLSKGFSGVAEAGADDIVRATELSVNEAYSKVENPVEGTILSVYRDAVTFANDRIRTSGSFSEYLDNFLSEAEKSLERTPEQLPVLKEAGVVDSGGAGLVYIFSGMKDAAEGKSQDIETPDMDEPAKEVDISLFTEDSVLEFGYCTEFLLRLQTSKVDLNTFDESVIKNYLAGAGNSLVFMRDGSVIKVHVHTEKPGEILNFCQRYGEFLTLKIENMALQHNGAETKNSYVPPKAKKKNAIVAVGMGDGIKTLFSELGADAVVCGGQSMNPSVGDFVGAYKSISAERIFVFPNNPNVIMTANLSASGYDAAEIIVVPTKSIAEGYMGISGLDTSLSDKEEILAAVSESMEGVVSGAVSRASRTANFNGVDVVKDDFIAFSGKNVFADSPDRTDVSMKFMEKIGLGKFDICLILTGDGVSDSESDALASLITAKYPRTEVIKMYGGQPTYDYIFILS